ATAVVVGGPTARATGTIVLTGVTVLKTGSTAEARVVRCVPAAAGEFLAATVVVGGLVANVDAEAPILLAMGGAQPGTTSKPVRALPAKFEPVVTSWNDAA